MVYFSLFAGVLDVSLAVLVELSCQIHFFVIYRSFVQHFLRGGNKFTSTDRNKMLSKA